MTDLLSPEVIWRFATDTRACRWRCRRVWTSNSTRQSGRSGTGRRDAKWRPRTREATPTRRPTSATPFSAPCRSAFWSRASRRTLPATRTPSPSHRRCRIGRLTRSSGSVTGTSTRSCFASTECSGTPAPTCSATSGRPLPAGKGLESPLGPEVWNIMLQKWPQFLSVLF